MKKEIKELQKKMYEEGMDIYYVPSSDFHASEYMHPYFNCREYLSGFDGSAGDMIITEDAAYLWTDGRYFLQAEKQLAGSGIVLMKMREEGVPTIKGFISSEAEKYLGSYEDDFVIGFDGAVVPHRFGIELEEELAAIEDRNDDPDDEHGRIRIKWDEDLVGKIWKDRPNFTTQGIWQLPVESAGKTAAEKIEEVREIMREEDAEYLFLSELSGIAWLLNMRGSDIDFTPVFYSYLLLGRDGIDIYLTDSATESGAEDLIRSGIGEGEKISVRRYEDIYRELKDLYVPEGRSFMADNNINYSIYLIAQDKNCPLIISDKAVSDLKMIKNEVEIESAKNAHIKDGTAATKFIAWLKAEMKRGAEHSEISASDYLENMRREQEGFVELSFPTIAGYGPNGAIVHYEATEESNAELKPEGFLLVDSGAQYVDGTTDITRTIALGPLTREMTDDYTYVLKSHIAYAKMIYEEGMSSKEIDDEVRKPLRDAGLDFNHGISHGVGHVLSVHENAATIRGTSELDAYIRPGMIMSDEPGVYKEGKYGIRIENLVLFKEDGRGGTINEPLTCVPYDRDAINKELLTDDEIKWIDEYHKWVSDTLSPMLDDETASWLERECAPL